MDISHNIQKIKSNLLITVGDIIRCKSFSYGIFYPEISKEISVGWSERDYKAHLEQAKKEGNGIDAYELLRGEAPFLVLSMELVEVSLPEDVEKDTRYMGINVRCIRLALDNVFYHESERIKFTLHNPFSCLCQKEENIEIVGHLDLPFYWNEKNDCWHSDEKVF